MLQNVGRVALVTGAASGIGEAISRLLVASGARVVLADVQREKGTKLAEELGSEHATFVQCDVSDDAQVKLAVDSAIQRFSALHCMINNAGVVGSLEPLLSTNATDFSSTLDTNLKGVFLGTKHAARAMAEREIRGCIINMASMAGMVAGQAPAGYTVSKAGVISLTQQAACELAPYGIRVNAVAPAGVPDALNPFIFGGKESSATMAEARHFLGTNVPLAGMPLKVEDVAKAVLYLASDRAQAMTGRTLVIGGEPFVRGPAPPLPQAEPTDNLKVA